MRSAFIWRPVHGASTHGLRRPDIASLALYHERRHIELQMMPWCLWWNQSILWTARLPELQLPAFLPQGYAPSCPYRAPGFGSHSAALLRREVVPRLRQSSCHPSIEGIWLFRQSSQSGCSPIRLQTASHRPQGWHSWDRWRRYSKGPFASASLPGDTVRLHVAGALLQTVMQLSCRPHRQTQARLPETVNLEPLYDAWRLLLSFWHVAQLDIRLHLWILDWPLKLLRLLVIPRKQQAARGFPRLSQGIFPPNPGLQQASASLKFGGKVGLMAC
mmetsp:Transcript_93565/g.166464  ORF Transcript_93565/g.166464 Transcript_93565/m.166464 type:complete len:274 (-) Transcript_93565:19-840(-)